MSNDAIRLMDYVTQDEHGDAVFLVVGYGRNGDLRLEHVATNTYHYASPRGLTRTGEHLTQ